MELFKNILKGNLAVVAGVVLIFGPIALATAHWAFIFLFVPVLGTAAGVIKHYEDEDV